jgi:erythrocyte membrane protein band 4.1
LVTNDIGLIEKDYFSLAFYEQPTVRVSHLINIFIHSHLFQKWLYKNKKISKQIKDLPWEFSLEVKFYVPDPRQLNEDFTRHLFTLQLRIDLYEAR